MSSSSGSADFGRRVWAPDARDGFVLGRVADIRADGLLVETNKGAVVAAYSEVFPADDDLEKDVEDNCALMYLNEATLLQNCRQRYSKKAIYSYVANILVSINPYEDIADLYSTDAVRRYQGRSLGVLPPHIFAIADKAYRDMKRSGESQSVVVSGESGAGKTESQKAVLRFLCESWGDGAGPVQQRLLETNPILEAFGNAKTLRNNNSSRFGKFVEIHFGASGKVAGGFVSHYLLERSRVCRQTPGERNFHVFYELIAGADETLYSRLKLQSPDKFNYLRHGYTGFFAAADLRARIPTGRKAATEFLTDPMVDDVADFTRLCKALRGVGLSEEELLAVFEVVAAILHLGNVAFTDNHEDKRGGCAVDPSTEKWLSAAATLLGLEVSELRLGLTSRVMQPTRGGALGTLIQVPLKPHEAAAARDALAKSIYSRLFDWIVAAINKSIPFGQSSAYIGVLDIAGFEFFARNSFEQFAINYCNEKLQQFFNERILGMEQELYAKEGLNVERIQYEDNADCIELFEEKGRGLLDLLDEEARLPRPSTAHFTTNAFSSNKGHFRLESPRKSRLKEHREFRDDEAFLVRHYAGTVCYETRDFLEKNNDQLHVSLEALVQSTQKSLVQALFAEMSPSMAAPTRSNKNINKLQVASVGSKFRSQLGLLIQKLTKTGTHFVRCIKPNSVMKAGLFEGAPILSQLKCAGMNSVLRLMQQGFPSRTPFSDLYQTYRRILPPRLASLEPRLFCKCLFRALGLNNQDYKFGETKVFFRPGKFAEFDQLLRQDPKTMAELVEKVRSWLNRARWKQAQYAVWSVIKLRKKIEYRRELIVTLQSAARGFLARKKHAARLSLFRTAKSLLSRVESLKAATTRLESQRDILEGLRHDLRQQLLSTLADLKAGADARKTKQRLEKCELDMEKLLVECKNQMAADEKARIEKARREDEERRRAEDEAARQLEREKEERRLVEERRAAEEREFLKREEQARKQQAQLEELQKKREKELEQERLDAALAQRLALENTHSLIVDNPSVAPKPKSRMDLSTWKYAELRDAINTSTDVELLLACKEEFHRRLRVYNDWKTKNEKSGQTRPVQAQRAPQSLYQNAVLPSTSVNTAVTAQRYFKVPFSSPPRAGKGMPDGEITGSGAQNGLWYAHFNGQWIARQIEVHPNKPPVLLVAGRDDLKMCELKLDETGLTRKKGAEILASEFDSVWTHFGGTPLNQWKP